jgi:hypothetical protein
MLTFCKVKSAGQLQDTLEKGDAALINIWRRASFWKVAAPVNV